MNTGFRCKPNQTKKITLIQSSSGGAQRGLLDAAASRQSPWVTERLQTDSAVQAASQVSRAGEMFSRRAHTKFPPPTLCRCPWPLGHPVEGPGWTWVPFGLDVWCPAFYLVAEDGSWRQSGLPAWFWDRNKWMFACWWNFLCSSSNVPTAFVFNQVYRKHTVHSCCCFVRALLGHL